MILICLEGLKLSWHDEKLRNINLKKKKGEEQIWEWEVRRDPGFSLLWSIPESQITRSCGESKVKKAEKLGTYHPN